MWNVKGISADAVKDMIDDLVSNGADSKVLEIVRKHTEKANAHVIHTYSFEVFDENEVRVFPTGDFEIGFGWIGTCPHNKSLTMYEARCSLLHYGGRHGSAAVYQDGKKIYHVDRYGGVGFRKREL